MNIGTKIATVLREACPTLTQLKDDYFIIGSAALNLYGIEIETSDIDIIVSDRDAIYLQTAWADKVKHNHVTQNDHLFRSNLTRFDFGLLDIETIGELEVNKNGTWMPLHVQECRTLNLDGMQIKLPTIEELTRIFYLFGREKDLAKIKQIEEHFTSYFLSFGEGTTRIELMHIPGIMESNIAGNLKGLTHLAISIGSKEAVDALTERLRADGYQVASEPRTSGDGYYESAVLDPEGNYIEITV